MEKTAFFSKENRLNIFLFLLAMMAGSLILCVQIHYLLIALLMLLAFIYFLYKPHYLYCFTIFTFTIQKHIRFSIFDFFMYEVFLLVCLLVGFFYFIFKNKVVNLNTKLDPYLFILTIIFIIGGTTSVSDYGYIEMLRLFEVILFFYITIYYLRAKLISPINIIKTIIFGGIIQAIFAIAQSFIGDGSILPIWLSSQFDSYRGYLGYLGLGSNYVWHGRGFFTYFIHFGMYMAGILLFFLPLKKYIFKDKKVYNAIIFLFIFAIITSYSRSALLALYLGLFYYSWFITINKKKFQIIFLSITSIIITLGAIITTTPYFKTICLRNDIWIAVLNSIFSNLKIILIGAGFDSFEYAVYQARAPFIHYYLNPHSFYLELILNLGLIGFAVFIGFLLKTFIDTRKFYKNFDNLYSRLSLSIHLVMFTVFVAGIWDRTYVQPSFFIIILCYLGILYARNQELSEKNY